MMMQRAHFEQALAVGQLEIRHLQDNGKRLHNVNDPHRDQQQRLTDAKGQSTEHAANKQRTGIAHKHLGRMQVPH